MVDERMSDDYEEICNPSLVTWKLGGALHCASGHYSTEIRELSGPSLRVYPLKSTK